MRLSVVGSGGFGEAVRPGQPENRNNLGINPGCDDSVLKSSAESAVRNVFSPDPGPEALVVFDLFILVKLFLTFYTQSCGRKQLETLFRYGLTAILTVTLLTMPQSVQSVFYRFQLAVLTH